MRKKILFFSAISVAAILLIMLIERMNRPQPVLLQGEVEAIRLDITTRVYGRVAILNVDVGDYVEKGQVLARLSSPQLMAQKLTAEAALAVAVADRARIYSTRVETIAARNAERARASADVLVAKQEYDRNVMLVQKGTVSRQRFDEINYRYQAALSTRDKTEADYRLAVNGSSIEEKVLADSRLEELTAMLHQVETEIDELTIIAPVAGQVTLRIAELGQQLNAGNPVLSLMNISDPWFVFHIREDRLAGLQIGDLLTVNVPALNNKEIVLYITVLNSLGQYANWRATKATGDFDLKTFEMRAKPVEPIVGLRPGMSAIITWENTTKVKS